jgi:hypothetical protein
MPDRLVCNSLKRLARPRGVEPLTPRSVVWCSIQLSYGRSPAASGAEQLPQRSRPRKITRPAASGWLAAGQRNPFDLLLDKAARDRAVAVFRQLSTQVAINVLCPGQCCRGAIGNKPCT